MPRPCKRRRICALPGCGHFGPMAQAMGERETISMGLDEYESIRLIDLEGLTQAQCAERMGVARTTAQAIYSNARAKLAQSLVEQKELRIQGGDYVLCDGGAQGCGCRCGRRCEKVKEEGSHADRGNV